MIIKKLMAVMLIVLMTVGFSITAFADNTLTNVDIEYITSEEEIPNPDYNSNDIGSLDTWYTLGSGTNIHCLLDPQNPSKNLFD